MPLLYSGKPAVPPRHPVTTDCQTFDYNQRRTLISNISFILRCSLALDASMAAFSSCMKLIGRLWSLCGASLGLMLAKAHGRLVWHAKSGKQVETEGPVLPYDGWR